MYVSPEQIVAQSSPYEPWQPSAGQRVRVRISPECQADHGEMDGITGTITAVTWDIAVWGPEPHDEDDPEVEAYWGHWYDVQLDVPVRHTRYSYPIVADLFAAAELEALP